jgi:hypothetical protein
MAGDFRKRRSLGFVVARKDNPKGASFAALGFTFQAGVQELAEFLDNR